MAFPFDPPEFMSTPASPPPADPISQELLRESAFRPSSERPQANEFALISRDPRALKILAKTIYRELRQSGLVAEDVMAIAGELLSLVTADVRARRR